MGKELLSQSNLGLEIQEENIQRKKLDNEVEETEENAKKPEVLVEREQKIQTEVKEIRKVFYCDLCNKQYKLVVEFEE
ncbi:hypothetical protein Dsin_016635 [Dipteronia sinensis]|uniref:Uncharacterized protein n=1 Tax=Dipteronia sinensis TaxID=43782 RepID=A0AAE0ADK9_9ROSI|nr:hypothetical protein Dsin_016635 [Dipteronia sinensis]